MKRQAASGISTAQLFIAAAGGLILYLVPQDVKSVPQTSQRVMCVIAAAAVVAFLLLLMFKKYETVGIALVVTMTMVLVNYTRASFQRANEAAANGSAFMLYLNGYDGLCWGLIWFIPFISCILIRLFAAKKWDTAEKRQDFCRFYRLAEHAFFAYYIIMFLVCFLLIRRVNSYGARQFNAIPLNEIKALFAQGTGGLMLLLGDLCFFIPYGFFVSIRKTDMTWWKKLLLAVFAGILIEIVQYVFNTGYAGVDDVVLNTAGFFIGAVIKTLLDRLRCFFTKGQERCVTYIDS